MGGAHKDDLAPADLVLDGQELYRGPGGQGTPFSGQGAPGILRPEANAQPGSNQVPHRLRGVAFKDYLWCEISF